MCVFLDTACRRYKREFTRMAAELKRVEALLAQRTDKFAAELRRTSDERSKLEVLNTRLDTRLVCLSCLFVCLSCPFVRQSVWCPHPPSCALSPLPYTSSVF